jgi:hypothetical protein
MFCGTFVGVLSIYTARSRAVNRRITGGLEGRDELLEALPWLE